MKIELIHKKHCDMNSNIGIPAFQKDETFCNCGVIHKHCWQKMKELNGDHGDCEFCCECGVAYIPGAIHNEKGV